MEGKELGEGRDGAVTEGAVTALALALGVGLSLGLALVCCGDVLVRTAGIDPGEETAFPCTRPKSIPVRTRAA